MTRTQIQIEDDVYEQLRQLAVHRHRSMAACVRDAITLFLNQAEGDRDDLSDVAGKFRPLSADGIKDHDRIWADSVIEGRHTT